MPVVFPTPLDVPGRTLGEFAYLPFNKHEVIVSPARTDGCFRDLCMVGSDPYSKATTTGCMVSKRIYNLHRVTDNHSITAGTQVYSLEGICPPLCSPNQNIFGCVFGIEFKLDGCTLVRPFSPFEMVLCYQLNWEILFALSHPNIFSLSILAFLLKSHLGS